VKAHLFHTGEVLREENRLLDELAARQAKECFRRLAGRAGSIDRGSFRGLPLALQRRLIRMVFIDLTPGEREISYDHVEQALIFIGERNAAGQENWLGKLNLISLPGEVIIADWESEIIIDRFPQLKSARELTIFPPAEVPLDNQWYLRVKLLRPGKLPAGRPPEKTAPYQAWLDGRTAAGGLTLRTRQPGDRIQPLGMGGKSIKVADLMINEKIPAQARKNWPLILSGEDIIWIPGLRISEQAKVETDSSQVCWMKIFRKEN
jgi:tRNA(Ile)-lysidine synthase